MSEIAIKSAPVDIYSYIVQEEANYEQPIEVLDGYEWSMKEHIRLSILYKNSQFSRNNTESQRDDKPFRNIVRPLLNLQYRAEGFDVKDIELFINESKKYFKSFLLRKYHEKWARENNLDTFIDSVVESYIDFGCALLKKGKGEIPEVVKLQTIAFADQTSLLGGPIAFRHFFAPNDLRDMEKKGWGDTANGATITVEDLIILSENSRVSDKDTGRVNKVTGKYTEIYEVHGILPESYLFADGSEVKYTNQMHIVAFYTKRDGQKQGVTLFSSEQKDEIFKVILRDEVFGRALGFGGVEELFEPQVWVNYNEIRMKGMLDAASKVIFNTTDNAYANRNNLSDVDNLEVLVTKENTELRQIDTTPRNIQLFDNAVQGWEDHAKMMASANESILGESPASGTPFRLQELVTAESHSLHEYRKGKLATFFDEVYRDWIIPILAKEVTQETEFLAELKLEELEEISERVTESQTNKMIKDKILKGDLIFPEDVETFREVFREKFLKQGNKRFLKILKGEMKDAPISVKVNIVGKQKNMPAVTEKLVNIFRTIVAAPQVLDDPRMSKLFNEILENSGLSPIEMGFRRTPQQPPQQPAQADTAIKSLIPNV